MKAKRVALWGILSAAAIGISALEGLFAFPFLPPGAKPGLSNSVVILAAINSSFAGGIYISVIKSLFALFTRGTAAFILSLAGGITSSAVTALLIKMKKCPFSLMGTGIIGAIVHNGMQLLVSCLLSGTAAVLYYAPALLVFACISGALTGFIAKVTLPFTSNAFIKKEKK